jgi:hypothetical protein
LGKNRDETSLRAAASLAYYGAFHHAGERLEELTRGSSSPFVWTSVLKGHRQLRNEWTDRKVEAGYAIAELLFFAHELRKKADYDLHLVFTPGDKDEAFQFVAQVLLAARRAG